ncbi:MAG: cytidylate kinase-like family protein [Ignavibacteriales bacterium]|nr:MAG: cytidylate kinase-like family protein [Ignavibacteriales bacterium]
MLTLGELEKCRRYIESHSGEKMNYSRQFPAGPCITISRETGTCAKCISEELIKFFTDRSYEDKPGWTLLDKNIIAKVLEEYNLPGVLEKLMEEEKISFFGSFLNEMFSGLPGQWTLIKKESETILRAAYMGNVIIIGRGANIVTQNLSNSFHIRLVAPLNERVKKFAEIYKLDPVKAREIIEHQDSSRMKYISTVFNKKIDDPGLYNLILNIKGLSNREIAEILGSVILKKFPQFLNRKKVRNNIII